MDEGQAEDKLAKDRERRARQSRWVLRGSVALVALTIAGWFVASKVPTWVYDRAEKKSATCFAAIERTGAGDPSTCVADLWFHGILGADRFAARVLEDHTSLQARILTVEVASLGQPDAARRDAALRARRHDAKDADDYQDLSFEAQRSGAFEITLELAETAPAWLDAQTTTSIVFDGLSAAIRLGELDRAEALIAPRIAAGETAWSEWIGCVLGLACSPPADKPKGLTRAVLNGENAAARHATPAEISAALPSAPKTAHMTSPWTLWVDPYDPDPARLLGLADLVEAGFATMAPAELSEAMIAVWSTRIEAARIAAVIGNRELAGAAIRAADRVAIDPRLAGALPLAEIGGVVVAALPTEEALGWLDRAGEAPAVRLDRALVLATAGRDAEALTALRDTSPFDACDDEDDVCDALAWTKLAVLLHSQAPLPDPDDAALETPSAQLRLAIAAVIARGDPAELRAFRWDLRREEVSIALGAAAPMQLYVLGRLAAEGEDVEVVLGVLGSTDHPRRYQAAAAIAADLRGDGSVADVWRARKARVDAALARSPEAGLVGAGSF